MDGMNALLTRRSIRVFSPEPVDLEAVRHMLEAAMYAPSAGDQEPWRFVVIQDTETLKAIALDHPYASALDSAPMAILVCAATRDLPHADFWSVDCAAATQNLMLAAHMQGLGTVWIGLHPRRERMSVLSRILHLPDDVEPFALVPVGHPLEKPAQPDRYHPEWIRSETWFDAWAFGRADLQALAEKKAAERQAAEAAKLAAMKWHDAGLHE